MQIRRPHISAGVERLRVHIPWSEDPHQNLSLFYFQCPETACKIGGPRVHCLILESERICLHTYLTIKAGLKPEAPKDLKVNFEIDRDKTIDYLVKNIIEKCPSAMGNVAEFLRRNKIFVDDLCRKNINKELDKYSVKECPLCKTKVIDWPHKTKDSFLVTIGEMKKIKVTVKKCPECKILLYLDLYEVGIIPVHNKANFSFFKGVA